MNNSNELSSPSGDLASRVTLEGGELVIRIPVRIETHVHTVSASFEIRAMACLTKQQYNVFRLLLDRLSNKEIANVLNISYPTAKFHVRDVLHKLGCTTRAELWFKAME